MNRKLIFKPPLHRFYLLQLWLPENTHKPKLQAVGFIAKISKNTMGSVFICQFLVFSD